MNLKVYVGIPEDTGKGDPRDQSSLNIDDCLYF